MPPFKSKKNLKNINPNSYEISKYGVCLPNGYDLTEKKIKFICNKLLKFIG
jgi:dTDP-4-amino-4,6-dideoxygalactose transaminase